MSSAPAFDGAAIANYAALWQRMTILPERAQSLQIVARKILRYKDRYLKIEKATNIPWWWVGITHYREADCNFHCHLHNGDPLTARTHHVPAGRPLQGNPPFTWEESAIDALMLEHLDRVKDWCITQAAYSWEAFNGWGYERMGVTSAYLWAGTNDHAKGKYVADHDYEAGAEDAELGTMPLLQCLMTLDPTIRLSLLPMPGPQSKSVVRPQEAPATQVAPKSAPTPGAPRGAQRTPWAVLVGTLTSFCTALGQAVDAVRPLLADPRVIALVVAIVAAAAAVVMLEHAKHAKAMAHP